MGAPYHQFLSGREGDGDAGRPVDPAGRAGAPAGQPPLQRAATWRRRGCRRRCCRSGCASSPSPASSSARTEGGEVGYALSPAGEELRPVIEALGAWGTRWMGAARGPGPRPEAPPLGHAPQRRSRSAMPARRDRRPLPVPGRGGPRADLVVGGRPRGGRRLAMRTPVTTWTSRWRSRCGGWSRSGWATSAGPATLRAGDLQLVGPSELCRALPRWFTLSPFATVPRPASAPGCVAAPFGRRPRINPRPSSNRDSGTVRRSTGLRDLPHQVHHVEVAEVVAAAPVLAHRQRHKDPGDEAGRLPGAAGSAGG